MKKKCVPLGAHFCVGTVKSKPYPRNCIRFHLMMQLLRLKKQGALPLPGTSLRKKSQSPDLRTSQNFYSSSLFPSKINSDKCKQSSAISLPSSESAGMPLFIVNSMRLMRLIHCFVWIHGLVNGIAVVLAAIS